MNRCRRTDAIAEIVADPTLGADALTEEQNSHVSVCADCYAMVADLERLDAALTAGLRSRPREELPISILATPALPRRTREGPSPMPLLAAAAVVVLAMGLTFAGGRWLGTRDLGLGPGPSGSPVVTPTASASAPAASSAATPQASGTPIPSAAPEPVSLEVGTIAAVVDEPLVVRTAPGTDPETTITSERLWIGQRVRILDGPARSDGFTWWEVQVGEIRGWVADGERDGSKPWLSPIANGRIAFWRYQGEGSTEPTLFTINADGTDERAIGSPTAGDFRLVLSCGYAVSPLRWTHDGRWAAFDYTVGGCDRSVFAVRADGSEMRKLGDGSAPAWRPTGDVVAFAPNLPYLPCGRCDGNVESGPWELLVAGLDGTPATALTTSDRWFHAGSPAWSPDRRSIAYDGGVVPEDNPDEWASSIYVADADGSNRRTVTDGVRPTWSPDGRWIVFETLDAAAAGTELHRIRPDGSDESLVGPGHGAAFSPDGSRLAVVREDGVWTMAVDGSEAALVLPATSVENAAWAPDGSGLVVASDHASGVIGISIVRLDGDGPTITELLSANAPSWQPVLLDPRLAD